MNICILTSSFPSHAKDVAQAPFLIDFIEGLKKRDHQVFVFTQDRGGTKGCPVEGIHIEWFRWVTSKKPLVQLRPWNPVDGIRISNLIYCGRKAVVPFVKENKIDACLALWILPSGYFASYAHQQTGVPYSVWALGSDIYRYGRIFLFHPVMKRIILRAKGVFADGFDLAERVEERFERKCHFLATTRRIRNFSASPKREEGKRAGEPYRFLFVGRLEKVKGIDLLLESMAMLKGEGINIHLSIVGGGSLEVWARDFVRRRGLERWVTLEGNIDDESLAQLYTSCDSVVIPSRSESIPLVFSEALNFDKDLIVSDVGDMGFLAREYEVGWVVPPGDPIALKEAMKRSVESKRGREIRASEKRETLKRIFNIERSVERFLADYE